MGCAVPFCIVVCPLLLCVGPLSHLALDGGETHVGRRFRFELFSLSLPGFDDEMEALWDGCRLDGLQVPSDPLALLDFKLCLANRWLQ
jgi:hypothetical protein